MERNICIYVIFKVRILRLLLSRWRRIIKLKILRCHNLRLDHWLIIITSPPASSALFLPLLFLFLLDFFNYLLSLFVNIFDSLLMKSSFSSFLFKHLVSFPDPLFFQFLLTISLLFSTTTSSFRLLLLLFKLVS